MSMKVKEALRRIVILVGLLAPSMASADVIYQTADPFGGPFGLWGADVFERQSVALRITPTGRYTLDSIGLWFMNNDFSGMHHDTVILTLRDDAVSPSGGSIPSDTIHENWAFQVTATGWDPRLETVASVL